MMKSNPFFSFLLVVGSGLGLVHVAAANPFTEWLDGHEVPLEHRGMNDSASGDGVSNIVKYALGLDPMERADPSELPSTELATINGERRLRMEIERTGEAGEVDWVVEASSDLETWVSEEVNVQENGNSIVAEDTVSTGDSHRRFLRFRVEPPFDGYLYMLGGRTTNTEEREEALDNVDEELDAVIAMENFRSTLVADVSLDNHSVTNWRRSGIMPTTHPANGGDIQWNHIERSTHVHNGRIYAGPGHFYREGHVPANFVTWTDIDYKTGRLGEFSTSEPMPEPPTDNRLQSTAIVEIEGNAYYYILGGNQYEAGLTDRIIYAAIDSDTGELGDWQESDISLPTSDWLNASLGVGSRIIHSTGNGVSRGSTDIDRVIPDPDGNITTEWVTETYDDFYARRWDYTMAIAESPEGNQFLYLLGGVANQEGQDSANLDEVDVADLVDGVPANWRLAQDPIPDVRRRGGGVGFGDMLILPGGSVTFSYNAAHNDVYIGAVANDGEVSWSVSDTPLLQIRNYGGTAAVRFARDDN